MPGAVLLVGVVASLGAFFVEKASVRHSNELLLRQEAVQGSLVLGSYVGVTPADVSQLAQDLSPAELTPPAGWSASAAPVAKQGGFSTVSLLEEVDHRLVVVDSFGTVHEHFGGPSDASIVAALKAGHSPYAGATANTRSRWLTQLVVSPSAPGYVVYTEQPVSTTPIALSSLPGHPFSGIEGAIYVGRESPQDLVFASTSHLPLTGERAVTIVSGSNPFDSSPAELSTRVGSLSDPGGFILVLRATGSLSGTTSEWLPWILLITGLLATVAVTGFLGLSESRRARMLLTMGQLEERNADLDGVMDLQKSTAARFSAMVRSSSDLTTVISADGQIRYESPSSSSLLGLPPDELLGTNFPNLVHDDDLEPWHRLVQQSEMFPDTEVTEVLRLRASNGSYVSVETRMTNLLDNPDVAGIVLNSRDVTDHKRLENELRHQAFHDSLTGLANRALFEDRLENALARLTRSQGSVSVLFLDLDDFKAVNDGRGHKIGDELLRSVGERLSETVRAGDTLARIGGDEFAVLVESKDHSGARQTADRVQRALQAPIPVDTGEVSVRSSIGIATTSTGDKGAQELLRDADVAMYAAKNAGKGRIEVFHSGLHDEVINRLQLEVELGRALENDEFSVHYQTLVDLGSDEVVGMEALMRWEHPLRGMVMPAEFIPVAESTGLIVSMGEWLLRRACTDARLVQEETNRPGLHLAVNLSARQLEDSKLVEVVDAALRESRLHPSLLTLEITESVFMTDRERCLSTLEQLKALGVRLSIDDFGTGYSSLGYLQTLPVDELKIDRTFVVSASVDEGDESNSLVHTIVRMARDFGLDTVAEGIETEHQLEHVRGSGCHLGQGYLFAKPVGYSEILERLVTHEAARLDPEASASDTTTSTTPRRVSQPVQEVTRI